MGKTNHFIYVFAVYVLDRQEIGTNRQMFFINVSWMVWQKSSWTLNNAAAVVYLVSSVTFTILGIVLMVYFYRWGLGKLFNYKNK